MSRDHIYRLDLTWSGSAAGPTSSYQSYSREYVIRIAGKAPLKGSADVLFRGDASLHNPEELLLATLSSCHMLSFLAEASRSGVLVQAYEVTAEGTMSFEQDGGQFTRVVLHPRVVLAAGTHPGLFRELHDRAHENCFIARSVNFPVEHVAVFETTGD